MKRYNRKYYGGTAYSERFYCRWTKEEDEMILEGKMPDKELAFVLQRSINSIQKRRWTLKHKSL